MNLSKLYLKYIIKGKWCFIFFNIFFICLFLFLTLSIDVNVYRTYESKLDKYNQVITISEHVEFKDDLIFLYENRNDAVYSSKVIDVVETEKEVKFKVINIVNLNENIFVDLFVETESLIKNILIRAGNSYD